MSYHLYDKQSLVQVMLCGTLEHSVFLPTKGVSRLRAAQTVLVEMRWAWCPHHEHPQIPEHTGAGEYQHPYGAEGSSTDPQEQTLSPLTVAPWGQQPRTRCPSPRATGGAAPRTWLLARSFLIWWDLVSGVVRQHGAPGRSSCPAE